MPTVVIFVDGEEVERLQGLVSQDALADKLAHWTSNETVAREDHRFSKLH